MGAIKHWAMDLEATQALIDYGRLPDQWIVLWRPNWTPFSSKPREDTGPVFAEGPFDYATAVNEASRPVDGATAEAVPLGEPITNSEDDDQ